MWTIPNILTLIRLIAAPMVAVMFLYFARPWADWAALILFVCAALTDWFDGFLARRWQQESQLGAMLDPIADKAMVVIALLIITGFSGMDPWILLPAVVILFREVFVSGLREFLGDVAGTLGVTRLAKWKTTFQMLAIAALFAKGIFEHHIDMAETHPLNLGMELSWIIGQILLWIAAILTLITGIDYFRKALPHLRG